MALALPCAVVFDPSHERVKLLNWSTGLWRSLLERSGWCLADAARGVVSGISATGHWVSWRGPCIWTHGDDDGLCHWSYFRMPLESGCDVRSVGGGRFAVKDVIPYIIVQVLGAVLGAAKTCTMI